MVAELMRRIQRALGIAIAMGIVVPSIARAQEAEPAEEASKTEESPKAEEQPKKAAQPAGAEHGTESTKEEDFGHGRQFNVRVGIVGGYRMIFRYDQSPFCIQPDLNKSVKDQQKFCGHMGPAALEASIGFAMIDQLEPFLFARFGLAAEEETDTDPLLMIGMGARLYTMSDSKFKIFIEPAIAAELEGGRGTRLWSMNGTFNPDYKKDLIFHLAAGPQYDLAKAFGIYADMGLTVGILRDIQSILEFQLGVQARFP
jgi:hypothetical protein